MKALAVAALALALAAHAQEKAPPRNVLVIVLDDVGTELIGAYDAHFRTLGRPSGGPASTPAIDSLLAARGVMFTSSWTAPMCSPSRAQMLTGRHGFRTGVGRVIPHTLDEAQFDHPGLALEQTLLPEVLHGAPTPYACAALGKWHLASSSQLVENPAHPLGEPRGRWFDVYAGSLFNLRTETAPATSYSRWIKTYATAIEPGVDPCGERALPCDVVLEAPPWSSYATVDTIDDALAVTSTLRGPWFVLVSLHAAHSPAHDVPAELPRASCDGYAAPRTSCGATTTAERVRCALSEADAQIARLLCAVGDEPVIVLASDNGTAADATLAPFPAEHAKDTLYQGGVNVPWIVRSPDIAAELRGTACDALVSSADLFATVAEIAGAASRAEDSRSLVPLLSGATKSVRTTLYAEEFTPNFTPDELTGAPPEGYRAQRHGQALTDGRFKLIRTARRGRKDGGAPIVREELYDLRAGGPRDEHGRATPDWFEQNDLLRHELSDDAARAVAALRAELDARYARLVR